MRYFEKDTDGKTLLILIAVSLIFTLPVITANIYYRDDLDRVITGYYGWSYAARPLADLVMQFLSGSGLKLVDFFPFSTIFSAALIGFASFLIKKYLDSFSIGCSTFISSLFIINPLFLQNLLYRYDGLPMSLALMMAVSSYVVRLNNIYFSYITRVALAVASLSLYQPCFNIFIAFIAIELICALVNNSQRIAIVFQIAIKRVFEYLIFYSIYYITIGLLFSSGNSRAKFISIDEVGFSHFKSTVMRLYDMLHSLSFGPNLKYLSAGLILFSISCISLIARGKSGFSVVMASLIVSIFAFLASLLGPTIMLIESPVMPRAVVSVSVVFVATGIMISSMSSRLVFLSVIPVMPFFAASAQIGNAVSEQRSYEDNIFNMITYDIMNKTDNKFKIIKVVGTPNISPRSKNIISEHPYINYLISPAGGFQASFILEGKGLRSVQPSYGKEVENTKLLNEWKDIDGCIISSNSMYSLYRNGDVILVNIGG